MQISAPKSNEKALEKLLDKMYISNVSKRLRELNQPNDIDRKRWVWELLQNAKDTITNNPNRESIKARILIEGDLVKFQHDGDPFTADARLGLLYKYSEDKENAESTGRFGTGFLTTHCLSKVVAIESNMYGDENEIIGFSVTMYRDGFTEKELLDGLDKMRASERYYSKPYEWTTYIYHINSDSGRRAVQLGKENFKENIAQTLLFCKELSSVELIDNGERTLIERISDTPINNKLYQTQFSIIVGSKNPAIRTFIHYSTKKSDEELSAKYKVERYIRLQAACEVDSNKNIISTDDKTSLFCVFPLVGIEGQIQMPIFVNSPDFEPDSERQSLILNGITKDDEKNVITEVGINQKILCKLPDIFKIIVEYLSEERFNKFFNLCNGLKTLKDHEKLDKDWYKEYVILELRKILKSYPIVTPFLSTSGALLRLSDCIVAKENNQESEVSLLNLLTSLYPENLVTDNSKWAHSLWKDDEIKLWTTDDICADIAARNSIDSLYEISDNDKFAWYNKFLAFVLSQDELLLKKYALLPNMNGMFLKKDKEGFKQGEGVTSIVLEILEKLGGNMKPLLLHESITAIKIDSKFNSTSYSAKVNSLAKSIIDTPDNIFSYATKLAKLLPIISIVVSDNKKFEHEFITKRSRIFIIAKELFQWHDAQTAVDNSLNKVAWEETDKWLVNYIISTIESKKFLANLPVGLDAKWLNDTILSLDVTLSTMDNKAIVPNQNGRFCLTKNLFIDNGIPEVLKNDVFGNIGLLYKDILLDNAIDLKSLGKTSAKGIKEFATDLSEATLGYPNWNSSTPHNSYGLYRKYSEEALRQVSLYLIQVLPITSSENENASISQRKLKHIARYFLYGKCEGIEESIQVIDNKLWHRVNEFVCHDIVSVIEKKTNTKTFLDEFSTNDDELFENLNVLYKYIENSNLQFLDKAIYPNQAGNFVIKEKLYKETESIDRPLKDIIALISDDENNYYNILIDPRCVAIISKQKSSVDAYAYIDGRIKELYDNSSKWEDEKFRKATRLLIDEWGELNKSLFDENHFPKVYPIKDSVSMNVVWTKNERQQLQALKNNLNEEDLTELVKHIKDIKDLSSRNKELEDENARLKQEVERLRLGRIVKVDSEESEMSKRKMYDAQLEAQRKLMKVRQDWKFPEGYGNCNEDGVPNCYSTVEIQDELGEMIKIVLKSYRNETEPFKVNPTEWEWVVKESAKLLVYLSNDEIVEVPKDNLVKEQSTFSITFDAENLDVDEHEDRLNNFSSLLKYFNDMHFNFASFRIPSNAKPVKNIYAKKQGVQNRYSEEDIL
jgi:hypothetical protein